jgi:hypothetical protein
MKITLITVLAGVTASSFASAIALAPNMMIERQACENSPTSRGCWGEYSIDTDWYSTVPNTGVTREVSYLLTDIAIFP